MSTNEITTERKDQIIKSLLNEILEDLDPDYLADVIFEVMTKEELEAYGFDFDGNY